MPRYFTQSCNAIIKLSKRISMLQILFVAFGGITKNDDF